ncbi:MAG: hypothetical protein ACE5NP_11320 [Anaerolineae bacterium]
MSAEMMKRMRLGDLLGDFVSYRNLEPVDERLLGLGAIRAQLGLAANYIPRKTEPAFATVIVHFLRQLQSLLAPDRPLEHLLYIGDTAMNDGMAIANLGQHLPILGFIGHEKLAEEERIEVRQGLMIANRWTALADFLSFIEGEGFPLEEGTAVLVDLDKTAFGARGRNDGAIDRARVEAVRCTVEGVLGADFHYEEFRAVYDELNQPRYHPFTADNQDYLAYVALMVSGGAYDFAALLQDLDVGRLSSFPQFVAACARRVGQGQFVRLLPIHEEVYSNLQRGDPTPFKSFRYREYVATVARMDFLPDDTDQGELLAQEIVITGEVAEVARYLKERGMLLFGLSDKPDEASIPKLELEQEGYLPVHRTQMKVVGRSLSLWSGE